MIACASHVKRCLTVDLGLSSSGSSTLSGQCRTARAALETGWQLSHGEQSRLFIARTLLQNTDVVILDESLAALDPENMASTLRRLRARAPSLVVIAHP